MNSGRLVPLIVLVGTKNAVVTSLLMEQKNETWSIPCDALQRCEQLADVCPEGCGSSSAHPRWSLEFGRIPVLLFGSEYFQVTLVRLAGLANSRKSNFPSTITDPPNRLG